MPSLIYNGGSNILCEETNGMSHTLLSIAHSFFIVIHFNSDIPLADESMMPLCSNAALRFSFEGSIRSHIQEGRILSLKSSICRHRANSRWYFRLSQIILVLR